RGDGAGATPSQATTSGPSPPANRQALTLSQESDDRFGQANAWDSLDYVHHHLSDYAQAIACYRQALTLFRELGNRYGEADTLTHLSDTHHDAAADPTATYQQALTILTDLDHPNTDAIRTNLATLDTP